MLDPHAHLSPVCDDDTADYCLLSDDGKTEAASRIGRVGILIVEATFDAAKQLEPLRHDLASAIRNANGKAEARAAIKRVTAKYAKDDDLGNSLFVPMIMSDMAGQLMARREVPEAKQAEDRRFNMVATGESQPVDAFLNLPWEEAIREFKARGVMRDDEFSRMLGTYAGRADEARQLMLERIQERVYEMLTTAIEDGQTFREFSKALDAEADGLGITDKDPAYLSTVFRTNVQSAYGAGRYRAITDPDVATARPYVQYRTVGDARVRDSHAALDRTVYRIDGEAWRQIAPPNGFNCFVPGTLVSGVFKSGFRALYSGDVVELTTQSGCRLRVTPNHPVATTDGFVPAGELKQGAHVLSYPSAVAGASVREVDEQDAPPTIEHVFGALAKGRQVLGLRPVADDFHGDAARFNSEIDVVTTDDELALRVDTVLSEHRLYHELGRAVASSANAGPEECVGAPALRLAAHRPPASSIMRAAGLTQPVGHRHPRPLQCLGLGLGAAIDARLREPAGNDATADAEFVRDLVLRGATDVRSNDRGVVDAVPLPDALDASLAQSPADVGAAHSDDGANPVDAAEPRVQVDEVVSVRRMPWVGHVYDLESPRGWLIADGIVTANCRCSVVTLSVDEARGLDIRDALPGDGGPDEGFDGPPVRNVEESLL